MIASLKNSKPPKPIGGHLLLEIWRIETTYFPIILKKFLTIPITGHESDSNAEKVNHLVLSLGQYLCRSVTNGLWRLPKHKLPCIAAYVQKCGTHNINQFEPLNTVAAI